MNNATLVIERDLKKRRNSTLTINVMFAYNELLLQFYRTKKYFHASYIHI